MSDRAQHSSALSSAAPSAPSSSAPTSPVPLHRVIEPSVLYLGTPVYLVGTRNLDGSTNLAPASSHFALARTIVLGLEIGGQSLENVRRHAELTVNFPASSQWMHVERLARVSGMNPIPAEKSENYTFESQKFARAHLTEVRSELVDVSRAAELPLQLECRVLRVTDSLDGNFALVECDVLRVHAEECITIAGTNHIDPEAWHPLLYAYRHFYDRGPEVGWTWKTPLVDTPAEVARWEEFGGTWEVVSVQTNEARIDFLRCDGGEVAESLVSDDPELVRWAAVQLATRS